MPLFTQAAPAVPSTDQDTPSSNPDLPNGYDDPDGEWFVPVELCELYWADPDQELQHLSKESVLSVVAPADVAVTRMRSDFAVWWVR